MSEDHPDNSASEFWRELLAARPDATQEEDAEVRRFIGPGASDLVTDGLTKLIAELEAEGYGR